MDGSVLAIVFRDEERQVERLAPVEAGVAGGLVAVVQVALGEMVPAARAFGDVVPGELEMDAAGMGAQGAVDFEEAGDLGQDVVEVAGLVTAGGYGRVGVHRVAHPGDRGAVGGGFHDQVAQLCGIVRLRSDQGKDKLVVGLIQAWRVDDVRCLNTIVEERISKDPSGRVVQPSPAKISWKSLIRSALPVRETSSLIIVHERR